MSDSDGPGRRDDGPPRSVAAEAALLVELLSQRGTFAGPSAGTSSSSKTGPTGRADGSDEGECTCGGAAPAACRLCPVCQVIAFVQKINPDTIERIADFATFAATALRDVASAQRTASSREPEASDGDEPGGSDPGPATGDRP